MWLSRPARCDIYPHRHADGPLVRDLGSLVSLFGFARQRIAAPVFFAVRLPALFLGRFPAALAGDTMAAVGNIENRNELGCSFK